MDLQQAIALEPGLLPTASELHCLRPGLFVRLQLKSGSRFWASVTSRRRANGTFTARSEQSAVPVKMHDEIIFEAEHVFEIL